jgi:hypothetical protein
MTQIMSRRIIKQSDELKKVVEYFNDFHDGFIKSVRVVSGNKFNQRPPWEKCRIYKSNEERLHDTGLWFAEKTGLFIEIHHYNYDWPNKTPNNRIILYLKNVGKIDPNIIQMIGESISSCKVMNETTGLGLVFSFSVFMDKKSQDISLKPLICEKISIQEKSDFSIHSE